MSKEIDNQRVAECVSRLKKGDEASFDELVAMFERPIFNLVYRMLGHYEESNDLSQEIFVKMYRAIGQFEGRSKFSTWFYSMAVNMTLNRRRKLARRKAELYILDAPEQEDGTGGRLDLPDRQPGPDERTAHKELRAAVEREIATLPDDFATAVVMRDMHDLSYGEIAEALQCSVGTVKSRISRGRALLRERLKGIV